MKNANEHPETALEVEERLEEAMENVFYSLHQLEIRLRDVFEDLTEVQRIHAELMKGLSDEI